MKKYRIKKGFEIKRVLRRGKYQTGKYIIMYKIPTRNTFNRFAVCVSKKNGNSVMRNKLKRWVREAFRRLEFKENEFFDYIVMSKKTVKTIDMSYKLIENDINEVYTCLNK